MTPRQFDPRQLFDYAKANITGVHFHYSTKEEYDTETLQLQARLGNARTIPGTLRLHTFIPKGRGQLEVKAYSNSTEAGVISMLPGVKEDLAFDDLKGFVTVMYNNRWYLACILQTFPLTLEVKLSCLEPAGPSPSFVYPQSPDILTTLATNILTIVDPVTSKSGRTYTISEAESSKASQTSQTLQVKLSTA